MTGERSTADARARAVERAQSWRIFTQSPPPDEATHEALARLCADAPTLLLPADATLDVVTPKRPTPAATLQRLAWLGTLGEGWYHGPGIRGPHAVGAPFAPSGLAWLRGVLVALMSRGLPPPYLYPMPDEADGVQAEWDRGRWALSAAINTRTRTAYLHICHLDRDDLDEATVSLRPSADALLRFVMEPRS
jgi:hypothetical protein